MRDPIPAPLSLIRATTPLASAVSLRTLPLHVHEVLPSFCFYHFLNTLIAPRISSLLFPQTYPLLQERTRTNWNAHFVSLVQSCFINSAALWVMWADGERWAFEPGERVWGYTGAAGMVQGFGAGYFLWDLMSSATRLDVHGWGALIHAASAFSISMLGFVKSSNESLGECTLR